MLQFLDQLAVKLIKFQAIHEKQHTRSVMHASYQLLKNKRISKVAILLYSNKTSVAYFNYFNYTSKFSKKTWNFQAKWAGVDSPHKNQTFSHSSILEHTQWSNNTPIKRRQCLKLDQTFSTVFATWKSWLTNAPYQPQFHAKQSHFFL